MLAIRLPEDIEKRLEALARKTGRSKTFYAKEAILEHLQDIEDYYLAESRSKKNVQGISLDDVEKALGVED